MKSAIVYTFPLLGPVRQPVCAFFSSERDGVFAFIIKGVLDPSRRLAGTFAPAHFFLIRADTESVEHTAVYAPGNATTEMILCYDWHAKRWLFAENGGNLHVYEFYGCDAQDADNDVQNVKEIYTIKNGEIGDGDKRLLSFFQKDGAYSLSFSIPGVSETDPSCVYLAHWDDLHEPAAPALVGLSSLNISYITDAASVLISCRRYFSHSIALPERVKPAHDVLLWCPLIEFYNVRGTLRNSVLLTDFAFPVRNVNMADEDFVNTIVYGISIAEGPALRELAISDNDTIIVALNGAMHDSVTTRRSGFYWISIDRGILRFSPYTLGMRVSLCTCGREVFGADILDGMRRIWIWRPDLDESGRFSVIDVAPDVKRATLVVACSEQATSELRFWCIEECAKGLKVSLWDCSSRRTLSVAWFEGYALLEESIPFFQEGKPCGIAALNQKLFVIAVNAQRQLQLLRCE